MCFAQPKSLEAVDCPVLSCDAVGLEGLPMESLGYGLCQFRVLCTLMQLPPK